MRLFLDLNPYVEHLEEELYGRRLYLSDVAYSTERNEREQAKGRERDLCYHSQRVIVAVSLQELRWRLFSLLPIDSTSKSRSYLGQ